MESTNKDIIQQGNTTRPIVKTTAPRIVSLPKGILIFLIALLAFVSSDVCSKASATMSADIIKRVFAGESIDSIKPKPPYVEHIYEWKELEKWGIDLKKLPEDSVIQNRPVDFLAQFRWQIIGGIVVLIVESLLILLLLANIKMRRTAEHKLRTRIAEQQEVEKLLLEQEATLKEGEERFRKLMEQSPLAIVILTPAGQISQVNDAWMRLWGFNEEETAQVLAKYNMLTDKQIHELGIAPLVERAFAGESVVLPPMDYSGNRTLEELELEGLTARPAWIECHLYAVTDANGEIEYVVCTNVDITERKKAEDEALGQREALARVDRATTMGQLTGSIAHELNQPLTGILSNAQAAELICKNAQGTCGELTEVIADVVADAKRAGDVVRNLQELYREQKVEFLPLDINAVAEGTTQLLHSEFVMQHIVLTTEYAPSIPMVDGNKIQLQQVLVNLIMNGEQAMSGLELDDRRIHIATAYDANEVKAWVEDNGPGIEPSNIDKIFAPLATWKPGGTGLGLAISNSIIESHGGRMWAENMPERGARVGFAIPVRKKKGEQA
jgi:C4-dicarboxylate-specific signal transduction histidine kinase